MRHSFKGLVALGTAVALCSVSATALADTLVADGNDALVSSNDYTVTDCAAGVTRVATNSSGKATLVSTGNGSSNHFNPGSNVTFASSPGAAGTTAGITASVSLPATVPLPSGWNGSKSLDKAISATVPAGVAPGTYSIPVSVSGTNASGGASLTVSTSYSVIVSCTDTTPPVLTLPANVVKEATGSSTSATWTAPTANDAVDGARPVTCSASSSASFPVGTTTVNCSASDLSSNTANGSFTVTINDTTPPAVTAPSNKSAEATSSAGASVTYTGQSATDLVSGAVTTTCAPASGSTFPTGANTVICSATDAHANTGSATFTVTVGDSTAPVVTVPGSITKEATGPSGAVATFSASATDTVDGAMSPTCAPASGSTFAIATTPVSCSATDAHSNTGSGSFSVTVQDTSPPVISNTPATATLEATGASGAPLGAFGPTASDIVDGAVGVVCKTSGDVVVDSSYVYPLGTTTTVMCRSTDAHSNTGTSSYSISVVDRTGPVLTVPANITAEATSAAGVAVSFSATATDLVDGAVTPDCSDTSGSVFPLGTTTVTCSATDTRDNPSNTLSFNIAVVDTTPPTIAEHSDEEAEATGPTGAVVSYSAPVTTDLVDGAGVATCLPASDSTFSLGDTTVECSASDAAGNDAAGTQFTVSVVDTTAPIIDAHGNESAEATSSTGAVVSYASPAWTDAVDGAGSANCTPVSDGTFSLGATLVTCTKSDVAGNAADPVSFTVTVMDTTAPEVGAMTDVVEEATAPAGAVVTFTAPGWTDTVDGSGTAGCLPVSGSTFSIGGHAVTCSYTDRAGNTGESSFMVTVQDTTAPIIAVHVGVEAEATSDAGAIVGFTEPATSDAVDGAGTASCTPAPGAQFPLGVTTVNCFAADAHRNASIPTFFTVTVEDTTAPVIAPHSDVSVEATGPSGAVVTYTSPGWTDAVDGSGSASCTPASGATFAVGATTVSCTKADEAGNVADPVTFTVRVVDTTAPVIDAHGNESAEATSSAGAVVSYASPAWTDVVDGVGTATCSPLSGGTFALGETTVSCTETDAAGNAAIPSTFRVTVVDTTAPEVGAMADIVEEATGSTGAVVTFTAPGWTDAVDGAGTAGCLPASGSTFSIGGHAVTCSYTDDAGNTGESTFMVTVQDTTAPIIAARPNLTVEATSAAGAPVSYTSPATSDAVDGPGTATCWAASGTVFALGTTTVNCSAVDAHTNVAIPTSFTIVVVDTTPPVIATAVNVSATSTAGTAGATATGGSSAIVTYTSPMWSDAVDGSGSTACSPPSGGSFPVGSTTITCTVTDSHGNTATSSFSVVVTYAWTNFLQPIDATPNNSNGKDSSVIAGTIFNKAKAGSSIPVKFTLGGYQGMTIFEAGFPKAQASTCSGSSLVDPLEETSTATTSGLKYDATSGQYNYTWKTLSGWAGTCQRLQVKLADGTSHYAFFQFTK